MKMPRVHSSLLTLLALPVLMVQPARADYQSTVVSDGPKAYYRFNDDTSRSNINKNSGSIGAAGDLTNTFNLKAFPGALAGSGNRSQFFDTGTAYGMIPFNAALNPDNTQPFTIEVWFYPASDQINGGECPINNRVSSGFPDRTGWVFFQRAPSLDYNLKPGYEGVGWNCRMYRGSGSATGLDVTSQVPFQVGTWQHIVVVYDPIDPVTNATLTIYVNGVAANTNIWTGGGSGTDPGYVANPAETEAALSLGAYNNTSGAGGNPYFGGMDEFAFYPVKLTPAQILAHYQNGTNASRATPYEALIQSQNPVTYLRLNEPSPGPDVAINLGDVRSAGIATNTAEVVHPGAGALVGRTDDGSASYHRRNGNSTTTIPWLAANNGADPLNVNPPSAGIPFTFEVWLRPLQDTQGGQCPVNNRSVGGTGRTGWVIFQRNPNHSYVLDEGYGWNFRMYSGNGSSGQDINTGGNLTLTPDDTNYNVGDYTIGKWQHLVVTWEPQQDNGDVAGNGNDQWLGTLTGYADGVLVAQNTNILYAANLQVPEDGVNSASGGAPADLAVGSYNAASGIGANPYEGDVDELAIYNNYILTPAQIMAHYQAGTNSNYGTNYATLVLTAATGDTGDQRLGPATYLCFNDPAYYSATNSGTLGYLANASLVVTTNIVAGPRPPADTGFDSSNLAVPLNGLKQWANLNNPSGLNISGQITLEAWVKPDAIQGGLARIISHGPQTLSSFTTQGRDNAVTNTAEVFLRIDTDADAGTTNYVVGSAEVIDGTTTNTHTASFAVPAGDLGGANWIYLVGTYDGANWKLYRNGAQVASAASAVGALTVTNGNWAIGSTGNGWENLFAGGIDDAAIYSTALSPAQVASHYLAGKAGTSALTIVPAVGGNVTISWPAGTTLVRSSTVNGTYTAVPGSPVSPFTIPASTTTFYKWSLP